MPWRKYFDVDEALERAMEVFWQKGFEGTSLTDLIEATGVQRQSLYNAIGDKKRIFIRSLLRYDTEQRQRMLSSLEARGEPHLSLQMLFDAVVDQSAKDLNKRGCFLVNTALWLQAHDDEVKMLVSSAFEDFHKFFEKQIEHGKIRGEFPSDLDSAAVASGLLGAFIGIRVMARGAAGTPVLRQMADQAMRLLECSKGDQA